jgi:hypothetical protein
MRLGIDVRLICILKVLFCFVLKTKLNNTFVAISRVGIHRANVANFLLDAIASLNIYFLPIIYICEIYIISFWRGIGLYLVCLTVEENAVMPEIYTVD